LSPRASQSLNSVTVNIICADWPGALAAAALAADALVKKKPGREAGLWISSASPEEGPVGARGGAPA